MKLIAFKLLLIFIKDLEWNRMEIQGSLSLVEFIFSVEIFGTSENKLLL